MIQWEERDGALVPVHDGVAGAWAAQPGSQKAFIECPVAEVLLEGNRGGGKSDVLLMDFAQYVGEGYGQEWRGVLFRKTYKQLEDLVGKAKKWFPRIWRASTFNSSDMVWCWPTGERGISPGRYAAAGWGWAPTG